MSIIEKCVLKVRDVDVNNIHNGHVGLHAPSCGVTLDFF